MAKDIINDPDKIEIRSDEIRELLGKIPHWIIRRGITIITFTIVVLIAGSALFRYPDIQYASIVLTTENPPVNLIARVNGKIDELFVKDNQLVAKGDYIALLETAANYEHIMKVHTSLKNFAGKFENAHFIEPNTSYKLGEIQTYFSDFNKQLQDYQNFIQLGFHQKKILAIKQELTKYNEYYNKLLAQSKVQHREYELARKQFSRDSLLFIQGVIADSDIENSESGMLKKEFSFKETETNLTTAKIQVAKLNQQVLDLELELSKEKKLKENLLTEAYNKLMAEIDIWEQTYLLITPVKGKVSFTRFWSKNQQVKQGEVVFTIIPENAGRIIGKIHLSVEGAGKVKKGQKVNVKFANYPFMEFGIVRGEISSISLVPNQNYYTVEVILPNGLVTNYGNHIEFNQEMPGIAEIITQNLSLLKRIINPVKSVIKKQQMNNR